MIRIEGGFVKNKLIYPELSYKVTGLLFEIPNEIGRFGREVQYGNLLAEKFYLKNIKYLREFVTEETGNRLNFLVENKIILELKTKMGIN